MKSPEQESPFDAPSPEWMDARVEAYLDGALPPDEAAAFEQRLSESLRWQQAVHRARQVRDELHALPRKTCPPDVTRAVLREVRGSDRSPARPAADRPLRPSAPHPRARRAESVRWWQPALAMSVLLAVVLTAALLGRPAAPEPPSERFTQAQIERATAEAEWTLAFLSRVAQKTGATVQEDVLEEHVAAPVREAVAPAFDGDTDDSTTSTDTSNESP